MTEPSRQPSPRAVLLLFCCLALSCGPEAAPAGAGSPGSGAAQAAAPAVAASSAPRDQATSLEQSPGWRAYTEAMELFGEEQYVEAIAKLEEAITLDAEQPRFYSLLGDGFERLGKKEDGLRAYKRGLATKTGSRNQELWLQAGMLLLTSRKYEKAEGALTNATRLVPDYAEAWVALGVAQLERGAIYFELEVVDKAKLEEAKASFERAVTLKPELNPAHRNLARIHELMRDLPAAEREYRRAIELDPSQLFERGRLAAVLARQQRYDEATAEYDKLLEAAPTNADFRRELGLLMIETGEKQAGEAELRASLDLDPRDPITAYALLWFLYEDRGADGWVAEREAIVRKYLATPITSAQKKLGKDLYRRALRLEQDGELRRAMSFYKQAVAANPQDGMAWGQVGRLLFERGELRPAHIWLETSLDFDKRNTGVLRRANDLRELLSMPARE